MRAFVGRPTSRHDGVPHEFSLVGGIDMDSLARVLDDEFRRVAEDEGLAGAELVEDVCAIVGKSPRQIYNYRSGKWPLPSSLIPPLCKRFKSSALLDALAGQVKENPLPITSDIDIGHFAIRVLKEVCDLHNTIIDADKGDIEMSDLIGIDEAAEKVIQRERTLVALLHAKYEEMAAARRKSAQ